MLNKNSIVLVKWDDHCTGNPNWIAYEKCSHNICTAEAVGFVVRDSQKYLTIALLRQSYNDIYSDTVTIIKSCITDLKILKK